MPELYYREHGEGLPLVIVHGLFGAGANWSSVGRQLADDGWRVLLPDLRNHGRSPQTFSMGYAELTEDIEGFLEAHEATPAVLVGHSLGGKIAMQLALRQPRRVRALAVVDIAPVSYPNRHQQLVDRLLALDPECFGSREEADEALAEFIEDEDVRRFLLMSLKRRGGRYVWAMNLKAIRAALPELSEFALPATAEPFAGPTLFLGGERSPYVRREHHAAIERWFPQARVTTIREAGHWPQVDQPEVFFTRLHEWLSRLR